jgi:predicted NAD/FAD-binding protein
MRYGFHEDGLMSGIKVAEALGCPFAASSTDGVERAA